MSKKMEEVKQLQYVAKGRETTPMQFISDVGDILKEYAKLGDQDQKQPEKQEERTFTKEELKRISELVGFMESDYPSSYWKPEDKTIKEKVSKLLRGGE
jgi:hypothetical protein